jgi:hypothetical protein
MKRSGSTGQRLVATFLLGAFILNYPILALFARPAAMGGIPLLYVFVFGGWTLLIGLMAFAVERRTD